MFWRLTLREISVILDGVSNRLKREHNERAWAVWHTAYLTAYAPQKSREFTKLKTLLHGEDKPKRRQTAEEIEAITRSWLSSRNKKR